MTDKGNKTTEGNTEESTKSAITPEDYEKVKQRARDFEARFVDLEKKLQAYGGDEGLQALKADLDAEKRKNLKTPEEIEAYKSNIEKEVRSSVQQTIDELKSQVSSYEEKIHNFEVVDKVTSLISSKFVPSAIPLLKEMEIKKYIAKDEDGLYIKDEEGKVRYKEAKRMTPEQFIEELSSKYPDLVTIQRVANTGQGGEKAGLSFSGEGMENLKNLSYEEKVKFFEAKAREAK